MDGKRNHGFLTNRMAEDFERRQKDICALVAKVNSNPLTIDGREYQPETLLLSVYPSGEPYLQFKRLGWNVVWDSSRACFCRVVRTGPHETLHSSVHFSPEVVGNLVVVGPGRVYDVNPNRRAGEIQALRAQVYTAYPDVPSRKLSYVTRVEFDHDEDEGDALVTYLLANQFGEFIPAIVEGNLKTLQSSVRCRVKIVFPGQDGYQSETPADEPVTVTNLSHGTQ